MSNFQTLQDDLYQAAQRYPKKIALDFLGQTLTYEQLHKQSLIFAASLNALGMTSKDRVALILPNCFYSFVCFYGCLYAGVTVVNISCLSPSEKIQAMLHKTQCKALISIDVRTIYEKIEPLIANKVVETFIIGQLASNLPTVKRFLARTVKRTHFAKIPQDNPHIYNLEKLLKKNSTKIHTVFENQSQPNDIALMQFSGGTTGLPKAVVHSNLALFLNIRQIIDTVDILRKEQEVFLGVLPYFHIFAITANMFLPVSLAARIVIIPKLDYDAIIEGCIRAKVTVMTGVPSIYATLNRIPKKAHKAIENMRFIVSGGAPLEKNVSRRFYHLYKKEIIQGYGLTESPVLCLNPVNAVVEGTIGLPLLGVDYKILPLKTDPLESQSALSGAGELVIKAPQTMCEYWQEPKETQNVLREGWLYTGDIVKKDDKGYLTIVDRAKDLIITSGFNVFPSQVEQVFYQHNAVEEILVIGVVDKLRGQSVWAYVKYKHGQTVSAMEWDDFLKTRLNDYEIPRKIICRNTPLPRTAVGKLSRQLLLAELDM